MVHGVFKFIEYFMERKKSHDRSRRNGNIVSANDAQRRNFPDSPAPVSRYLKTINTLIKYKITI